MADIERLHDELRAEIRAEFRTEAAAAAAAVPDAIRKKPEIPAFDKANVDIWVRRLENAYIRANITTAREKFAFLESKFSVGVDPRIDEFLYGDATDELWRQFLDYLKEEFGPTKQQRAAIFVDGFKRDGRRPSQYAAALDEKTKNVTIDDVKKEMLIREMPSDVRQMLQERIDDLSFKEAAKVADSYFDHEGRPRRSIGVMNVDDIDNHADSPEPSDASINAIPRTRPTRAFQQAPRPQATTPSRPAQQQQQTPTPRQNNFPQRRPLPPTNRPAHYGTKALCYYHDKFGNGATRCEVSCPLFDQRRFAGNDRAGRR